MTPTTRLDATDAFFTGLAQRRHDPLLGRVVGTFLFDLSVDGNDDSYVLTVSKGDVSVTHGRQETDCTVKTDRSLFNRIVLGEASVMAATLRGELTFQGDPELITLLFRRLFCRADELIKSQPAPDGKERKRR